MTTPSHSWFLDQSVSTFYWFFFLIFSCVPPPLYVAASPGFSSCYFWPWVLPSNESLRCHPCHLHNFFFTSTLWLPQSCIVFCFGLSVSKSPLSSDITECGLSGLCVSYLFSLLMYSAFPSALLFENFILVSFSYVFPNHAMQFLTVPALLQFPFYISA